MANALFEAVSGLTATGATVLTGLDHLPPGMLLWRSILQWIGGVGILAMFVLVLSDFGGGRSLYQNESSAHNKDMAGVMRQVLYALAPGIACCDSAKLPFSASWMH